MGSRPSRGIGMYNFETQITDSIMPKPVVLVTDDNDQARLLLRHILEREGFQVEEAKDGLQALDKAAVLHPDLILMDVKMPNMNGFEVVEKLRSDPRSARIPIIVVTAIAREPKDVAKGFGLGADDYLMKPFNNSELIARAHAKIRARRLEDKLHQRTQELETLVQIGTDLNQVLTIGAVADRLLAAILRYVPTTHAALALVAEDGRLTLERQNGLSLTPDDLIAQDTLSGYVLKFGEAMLVKDTNESNNIKSIFQGSDCRSGIAVPFVHRGLVLGVVALGSLERSYFTMSQLRVLRSVGEQAALAISNALLFTQLRDYAQNLEAMVEARTAALQAAQKQLMLADKLAALGTLAAGVAHEVNNPLQPLLMNLEMAIEDLDADRPVDRELLEFAKNDVQRIKRIVSNLLDFARPGASSLEPTNVNDVVKEVMALAGKQLQHARVKVDLSLGELRKVAGSADQLKQVILNLVVNAMDAMPGGGKLTIRTAEQEGFVLITVQDEGMGIPAEKLPQVFDPFFTTKAHGTGLGLSISHSIIESHGGTITVESDVGKFTRFTVSLPVIKDKPEIVDERLKDKPEPYDRDRGKDKGKEKEKAPPESQPASGPGNNPEKK